MVGMNLIFLLNCPGILNFHLSDMKGTFHRIYCLVEFTLQDAFFFLIPQEGKAPRLLKKFSGGQHYTTSLCIVALYLRTHLVTIYFHGLFSFSAACVNSFRMTLNHSAAPIVLDSI